MLSHYREEVSTGHVQKLAHKMNIHECNHGRQTTYK